MDHYAGPLQRVWSENVGMCIVGKQGGYKVYMISGKTRHYLFPDVHGQGL